MPSRQEHMFLQTLHPKSAFSIFDAHYRNMVGLHTTFYYAGIVRPSERIEIRFFKLPELNRTIEIENYHEELEKVLCKYLMEQHDTMTPEEKSFFSQRLAHESPIIGHLPILTASNVVFGYVKLQ